MDNGLGPGDLDGDLEPEEEDDGDGVFQGIVNSCICFLSRPPGGLGEGGLSGDCKGVPVPPGEGTLKDVAVGEEKGGD